MTALLPLPASDKLPPGYAVLCRADAGTTVTDDIAEIIAARAWRGLDCPRAYLLTLGYPDATLDECLPDAEAAARDLLDRMLAATRYGGG